jgi:hypothetical protein
VAAPARPAAVAATSALGLIVLAACTQPAGELQIRDADPIVFRDTVYPVLLRDCGFAGCHGTHERFFSVFGPGRTRLDPATGIYDPVTPTELSLSFTRARSMILPEDPESSLLLRKPLARDEGGAGHKGDDVWGGPVFRTTADARFAALYHWATGR